MQGVRTICRTVPPAANAGILFWRIIAEAGKHEYGFTEGANALKSIFMILKRTSKMNPDKKGCWPKWIRKSRAIIRLIQRFYDPSKGSVEIDGFDIKFNNLRALRSHIAWVGPGTYHFAGSIHENIAYGEENATEAEIIEASTLANARVYKVNISKHKITSFFARSMEEEGTYCRERGVQLSGGKSKG
ncbi:putative multidrug resistance protein [Camellia lanceoleosa]|uniref:Multidrug resistance protein n=1 Tax=Camellia lanceoleosa TaxID=1840588 RepID=A0ACC0I248_9ERIC|nr:putative multidrug resistance protein [Camellia lanceoleosa]